jgi:hypothetical protein
MRANKQLLRLPIFRLVPFLYFRPKTSMLHICKMITLDFTALFSYFRLFLFGGVCNFKSYYTYTEAMQLKL